MVKSIGNLTARVSLNSAQFTKGVNKAKADVSSFSSHAKSALSGAGAGIISGLKSVVTAASIAATGAAAGLALLVKGSFDRVDALAKTADSLGITTEALSGLRHAADLAGVSNEEFDKNLIKMTKNVAAAAQGNAGAAAAFDRLGLSASRLEKLGADNQIKAIADQLKTVTNPTERAALAMSIFGKEGAKMVNVLADGAEGLSEAQAEAAKLGLTISRLDAARIEIANDSITRLKGVLTGAAQTIAIQLAPFVAEAAKRLTAMGTAGGGMGNVIINAVHFVAKGVAYLSDVVDLGKIAWVGLKEAGALALEGLLYPIQGLADGIAGLVDLLSDYLPDSIVRGTQGFANSIAGIRERLDDFATEQSKKIEDILVSESASEKVDKFFAQAKAASDQEAKAIADNAASRLAKQQEYNGELLKSVQLAGDESNIHKKAKKEKATRDDLKLLRAGTADAFTFVFENARKLQDDLAKRQLQEEQKQTSYLADIRSNTADDDLSPVEF